MGPEKGPLILGRRQGAGRWRTSSYAFDQKFFTNLLTAFRGRPDILRASPPAAGPLLQAAGCWLLAGWLAGCWLLAAQGQSSGQKKVTVRSWALTAINNLACR